MTDEELRQLIASNARAIQAAAEERAELRRVMSDAAEERAELRQAILKLTDIQAGVAALLSELDEDRPTVLRNIELEYD